jgi:uncharacterized protein YrrD
MLNKIELKEGVGVFTPDDKQVGRINRFVLNPTTNEVTHVVVQKGWLLTEDKVVPWHMVRSATEDRVVLNMDTHDFENLPPFEESNFIRAADEDIRPLDSPEYVAYPAYYWYPAQGYSGYPGYGLEYYLWPPAEKTRNIPENTIPLKEGASVISSDGDHVGDVERLIIDKDSNRATHFVIAQGILFKDRKLIPAHWVEWVDEDEVHLIVSSKLLRGLPTYQM